MRRFLTKNMVVTAVLSLGFLFSATQLAHAGCGCKLKGLFGKFKNKGCCGSKYYSQGGCCGGASYGGVYGYHGGWGHSPRASFRGGYGFASAGVMGMPRGLPMPQRAGMRRPLSPVTPPPGTVGYTYRRPSRPIPLEKHPRIAMLEVRIDGEAEVTVDHLVDSDVEGFEGNDGLWHFETKKPLTPGLPRIVAIKAKRIVNGAVVNDVRYVRLIPGRIVDIEFGESR
jgi:hypothetical protein